MIDNNTTMIKEYSIFVDSFVKASKTERAYVYLRFISERLPLLSLNLNQKEISTLTLAVNDFLEGFKKTWPWKRNELAYRHINQFIHNL
jgi:hypothetical protein